MKIIVAILLSLGIVIVGCARLPGDPLVTPTPVPTPTLRPKPVHEVERGDIVDEVVLLGMVDSQQRVNLFFRTTGRLKGFLVSPGDEVEEGQILAELDVGFMPYDLAKAQTRLEMAQLRLSKNLVSQESEIAEAQRHLEMAQARLDSALVASDDTDSGDDQAALLRENVKAVEADLALQEQLHAYDLALMEDEIELARVDVELLQAQIDQAKLQAPIHGIVRYTFGESGQMVEEYEPILGLADVNALEVRSKIYDAEAEAKLRIGQEVTIVFRPYPEQEITGKLIQVSTPAQSENGDEESLPIRIEFSAPNVDLEIGMVADVRIVVGRKEDVLLIPNSTVHTYFNRHYVLVKEDDRKVEVDVILGISDGGKTEVLKGLEEGELVFER
jgi:multidrug efflux pump subunit AcrA (membrane-fusion protein)